MSKTAARAAIQQEWMVWLGRRIGLLPATGKIWRAMPPHDSETAIGESFPEGEVDSGEP
jgi:hypothetical protein